MKIKPIRTAITMLAVIWGYTSGILPEGALKLQAATVALVARMPETSGVQWTVRPATEFAQRPNMHADEVTVRSTWQFAPGQQVSAESRLVGSETGEARILALQTTGGTPVPANESFLSHPTTTKMSLVKEFDPAEGRQVKNNRLLVVSHDAHAPENRMLFIRVLAL